MRRISVEPGQWQTAARTGFYAEWVFQPIEAAITLVGVTAALEWEVIYSYCVIELEWRWRFCAVRCSRDIVPGWLRGRRSDVGASWRSSLRHVVRDGRAAPRDLQFWG